MKAEFKHTGLSARTRFITAAFFYALAALLQLLPVFTARHLTAVPQNLLRLAGIALCLIPLYFLKTRNFSNKPADLGKEDWKPVTMTEIDRLADRMRMIRRAPVPFQYRTGFPVMVTCFAFFALIAAGISRGPAGFFFVIYLYLVFFPSLWFARFKKWYPRDLSAKLALFNPVFTHPFGGGVKLIPMIRFDEDKEGRKIPEDLRIMVEPKSKPADMVGAQLQLTFNQGPGGEVPYMYAVFITRGTGAAWQELSRLRFKNYITQAEGPGKGEYATVVLRLNTKCRGDGYHTKEADIKDLALHTEQALERFSGPSF
jgi:hypothetical protein